MSDEEINEQIEQRVNQRLCAAMDINMRLHQYIAQLKAALGEYATTDHWDGNTWKGEGSGGTTSWRHEDTIKDPTPWAIAADALKMEQP